MANRYWVGGTGDWNTTTTTHWSTTSGGAGGASVPTASDNVFFDGNSNKPSNGNYTVTTTAHVVANDITWSLLASGVPTITGSSNITASGNVVLASGMTWSLTGNFIMYATSGTKTLTSNGVILSCWGFTTGGTGGTFQLQDDLSLRTRSFTTAGFDANGRTVTFASTPSSMVDISNNPTFYNLTISSSIPFVNMKNDMTVTGLLSISGVGLIPHTSITEVLWSTGSAGTYRTITAGSVSLANIKFTSITGAGAASWNGTALIDGGGNSNITFSAYSLTYSASTGGSVSGDVFQYVASGESGTEVTATNGAGYHFTSWDDSTLTKARTDSITNANRTFTATFEKNKTAGLYGITSLTEVKSLKFGG